MKDRRILVTGASGQIAYPLVRDLAKDNEVWGIARFSDPSKRETWNVGNFIRPATREELDAAGVITRSVDLADPDWSELPDRFDHVLHLAVFQMLGLDYDYALKINAEGTGLLMSRFRDASFLVMSTIGVYDRDPDPKHVYVETDPLGDSKSPHSPTYSISKISQEAVARTMARTLNVPTTIARMGLSYGANGGLPAYHLDMMLNEIPIGLHEGATFCCPISEADITAHVDGLLDAASVPATIVNWGGDDVITAEDYLGYLGELTGVQAQIDYESPTSGFVIVDATKRRSLTGPCITDWRTAMREMVAGRHPDRLVGGAVPPQNAAAPSVPAG